MLEIFYESRDVYQLKDLEKIAPKLKGITSMSVKDVVTSLVDDGMVDTDKIGTSVYFWAFPSKVYSGKKRKIDQLNENISQVEKRAKILSDQLAVAAEGREETNDRTQLLERLGNAEAEHLELQAKLALYAENDPTVIKQKEVEGRKAVECANRWTDNIFAMQDWIKKNFPGISLDAFNKQFDIPDDLDYIQ